LIKALRRHLKVLSEMVDMAEDSRIWRHGWRKRELIGEAHMSMTGEKRRHRWNAQT
jgi:hypothetical protein